MSELRPAESCPCGAPTLYDACCGRYHAGGEPPDAESLMRSRFSAYARRDLAYLWRTLHPSHDDRQGAFESWRAELASASRTLRFRKLRVLATSGPDREGIAHVLFHAVVTDGRKNRSFAEHSRFAHDGTGWRYLDGVALAQRDLPQPISALDFDAFHLAARR